MTTEGTEKLWNWAFSKLPLAIGSFRRLSCLPRPQIRRPKAAGQIEAAHRRYPAAERTHRVALEHRRHVVRASGVGGQGDAVFE